MVYKFLLNVLRSINMKYCFVHIQAIPTFRNCAFLNERKIMNIFRKFKTLPRNLAKILRRIFKTVFREIRRCYEKSKYNNQYLEDSRIKHILFIHYYFCLKGAHFCNKADLVMKFQARQEGAQKASCARFKRQKFSAVNHRTNIP